MTLAYSSDDPCYSPTPASHRTPPSSVEGSVHFIGGSTCVRSSRLLGRRSFDLLNREMSPHFLRADSEPAIPCDANAEDIGVNLSRMSLNGGYEGRRLPSTRFQVERRNKGVKFKPLVFHHTAQVSKCIRTHNSKRREDRVVTPAERNIPAPPNMQLPVRSWLFNLKQHDPRIGCRGPATSVPNAEMVVACVLRARRIAGASWRHKRHASGFSESVGKA